MIRFRLRCAAAHEFDGWFAGGAEFDAQAAAGLIECPECGSHAVDKAPMVPAVLSRRAAKAAESEAAFQALAAEIRTHIAENFDDVGADFAEEARARHYGEKPGERPIYGETSPQSAAELREEGVAIAPLPAPFRPLRKREMLN